jgi:hypothetical protein
MALERRSPLPVGLYWIDAIGLNRGSFMGWRDANAAAVKVRASESFPDSEPPRDWIKFEVLSPVKWDPRGIGYPTIIPPGAKVDSSGDTVQREDPKKDPLDQLGDALEGAGGTTGRLIQAVALLGGALVLTNLWSRTRGR